MSQIAEISPGTGVREPGALERSPHTERNYARAVAAFRTWCTELGRVFFPAGPQDIQEYLTALSKRGLRYASIRAARAAIADAHRLAGYPDPTRAPVVEELMSELRQGDGGHPQIARALRSSAMDRIRNSACNPRAVTGARPRRESSEAALTRGLTDVAIIKVMSEAGLRRSEVATLRWRDITVREDGWGVITRPGKSGRESERLVGTACLADLDAIRGPYASPDDLVFGLSPSQIGRRVRAAAQEAGLGDGYTGQSCRIGKVYDLSEEGGSLSEIKAAGGWKSSTMPLRYRHMMKAGGDV